MKKSPQWHHGRFHNPQPIHNDNWGSFTSLFRSNPYGRPPDGTIPVVHPRPADLAPLSEGGLRVTWLGHSTVFLDMGGTRILTDPVWSERSGPFSWIGPRRYYAPPIPLAELPRPDVVVISHDHYDHLDRATIEAMRGWTTRFVVPLGVGARLLRWGIAPERITELDWWEATQVGKVEITATPARHASGRGLFDKDRTLWAGYAFRSPEHRVFFSGDTGLFPGMSEIGERLGPFDLTMLEIGAYGPAWPDWHLGPEQAVEAHRMVRGARMLPIHWGLFTLAGHGWTEPMERLQVAARTQGVLALSPRPGEPFELLTPSLMTRWWPSLPWRTAQELPIRAGGFTPDLTPIP
nr:MBL fold metallo-hydrolase [uncultured Holophaga sp.]